MSNYIYFLLSTFFSLVTSIYLVGILLGQKLKTHSLKNNFFFLIFLLAIPLFLILVKDNIRLFAYFLSLLFVNFFFYRAEKMRILFASFLIHTFFYVLENFFCFLIIFLFSLPKTVYNSFFFMNPFCIFITSLLLLFFFQIPSLTQKFLPFIHSDFLQNNGSFLISFLGFFVCSFSLYNAYFKLSNIQFIASTFLFSFLFVFLFCTLLHEKQEKISMEIKNKSLMHDLHIYEKIIENQKRDAHENKNQLRMIHGMIEGENLELKKYLEVILEEKRKEDKDLMKKVQNIPNSGLRALIYTKLVALEAKYNINLIISRNINSGLLNNITVKTNVDLCKIMGIFLDNAIEAAIFTEEALIGIELFLENEQLHVIISNSFQNEIDLQNMHKKGVSTKGKNRGFGLSLAHKILMNNKTIKNYREITNQHFFQRLIVDLKENAE